MMRLTGSPNTRIIDRIRSLQTRVHRLGGDRRPVLLPGIRLPARPGLLLLMMLLLGLFGVLRTIPARPAPGAVAEFLLLSDASFSNLNSTGAEAPADSPAPRVV